MELNRLLLFSFQVSFQATVNRNYTGGIAVDDVTLTDELCEDESEPQNEQGITLTSSIFKYLLQSLCV